VCFWDRFSLPNIRKSTGVVILNDWLYIAIFIVIAIFMPAAAITIATLIAPKKPNKIKSQVYECGIETVGDTWVQFKAQYYVFALVFLVFDVEVAFMFPWAVAFKQVPLFGVVEGLLFILILAAGLIYAWRKGALEWV
jgi:NADH:ubiquinone oxidoreductase subunit 3 (subunit A)